jgi:hypothetical protein
MNMNIIKEITQANGAVYGYHSVAAIDLSIADNSFRVNINSWVSETAKAGGLRHNSSTYISVPISGITITDNNIKLGILNYIVNQEPWLGATVSTTAGNSLPALQQLKWDEFKAKRLALEFGGFYWNNSHFDSIPISQSRIQGAVILAMQAALAGQPYSVDWTLFDNTVRTLSGSDMVQVGIALGTHVISLHQISRSLHAQVFAATTVEELDAVQWPT